MENQITPFTQTESERITKLIGEGNLSQEQIIEEYLKIHDAQLPAIMEGVKYYYKENDITSRKIYKYDKDGNKNIDEDATNNKLASGWHKLLVDQKTAYLVGDPVSISSKNDNDIQLILDTLGDDFDDTLPELVTAASNKGREWLHPYINSLGEFDYMIIPNQEAIPIYDNSKRKNLNGFIRVYELDDGTIKIELWDKQQVHYYEMHQGKVIVDVSVDENPQSHFYYGNSGYGWDEVPFIEFANNSQKVSDIRFYKDFIDAYDKLNSDTTNTLEDIQEIFYVIKGYSGTDIDHAVTNLKRFKGVATDGDGGVDTVKAEVPVESIHAHLERLADEIYQYGQGVNVSTDKFGNSPSGIALKFLFSLLDMKVNVLERKFSKGLRELMWFVCEYLRISKQGTFGYKDIQFTFNKSMLMNEFEQSQIAMNSKGIISDETIVANHPWVTDPQAELERLKKEQPIDLDVPVNGEEDE